MKAKLKLSIEMNIDLPEGDTDISEEEKCSIIDRVQGYLEFITVCYEHDAVLDRKHSDQAKVTTSCNHGKRFSVSVSLLEDYQPEVLVKEAEPVRILLTVSKDGGIVEGYSSEEDGVQAATINLDERTQGHPSPEKLLEIEQEILKKFPYKIKDIPLQDRDNPSADPLHW